MGVNTVSLSLTMFERNVIFDLEVLTAQEDPLFYVILGNRNFY